MAGKRCPSAPCVPGALLLGVVDGDGQVGMLPVPLPVDEAFVAAAHQGRAPESRFRFSLPCAEAKCDNWKGRCGVADTVVPEAEAAGLAGPPPDCGIRAECRWIAQMGDRACTVCDRVTTMAPDGRP